MDIIQRCGLSLTAGALLCAGAITAEALTDPLDTDRIPHYVAGLAAPVAIVLFAGILLLLAGTAGLVARLHLAGGRGAACAGIVGAALAVAEIPHTILDMSAVPVLTRDLPAAQAQHLLNDRIDTWPGLLSTAAIPFLLIASIVLIVRLWRGDVLPAWTPRWAAVMLVLAVAELPLSAVAWWLPHGPVLLYVGIAGYGVALARSATASTRTVPPVTVAAPA